jgi:hypothetical protein
VLLEWYLKEKDGSKQAVTWRAYNALIEEAHRLFKKKELQGPECVPSMPQDVTRICKFRYVFRCIFRCIFRCFAPLRGRPQPTGPNGLILIIIIIIIIIIPDSYKII